MSWDLILSHPSDYKKVYVPKNITRKLKKHNIQMIRDVHYCFNKKKPGILLNLEKQMGESLSISAYLKAICNCNNDDTPILIIANEENYAAWHFNLRKYSGLDLYILSQQNANNLFNKNEQIVILMKNDSIKLLDAYKDVDFFMVIVDDIDEIVTKRIFNRLGGNFNIGIFNRNFYKNRDQKLLWKILNWIGDSSIGKLNQFSQFDEEFLSMKADPYQESWFRYTWEEYKKPSFAELQSFNDNLKKWTIDNNLTPSSPTKVAKKRKNTDSSSKTKKKTPKLNTEKKITTNSDIENELTEIQELVKTDENFWKTLEYPKTLDISPKTQSTPKNSNKFRKYKSTSSIEYIDKFVVDEFNTEFSPKNKFSRNKSDTFCLEKHKIIDKHVLEEFTKDFEMENKERKDYHAQMDSEILSSITSILTKEKPSANILNIDEIFNNANVDEEIIPATQEIATQANILNIDEIFNNTNVNEEIIPTTQEIPSQLQSIKNDENSYLLSLFDMSSPKVSHVKQDNEINSSQKSEMSIRDIFSELFSDSRDHETTKEIIECCEVGSFSQLLGGDTNDTVFKEDENLIMKKQVLISLFGNDDFL